MKVKKLIELIKDYPDYEIVLSSDSEGNEFNKLNDVGEGRACFDEGWTVEVYTRDEKVKGSKKVLVFWPED